MSLLPTRTRGWRHGAKARRPSIDPSISSSPSEAAVDGRQGHPRGAIMIGQRFNPKRRPATYRRRTYSGGTGLQPTGTGRAGRPAESGGGVRARGYPLAADRPPVASRLRV